MTEQTTLPASTRPTSRPRVRLLALAGLVALAAGGTGALAATVARHTDGTDAPSSAASDFIPYAGPQGGSAGVDSAAGGAQPVAGMPAPVAAPAQGRASVSYGQATADSVAYPYPYGGSGVCTGSAPAQVDGQVLTATGSASIAGSASPEVYVLTASLNSQSTSGASTAVADVQRRLAGVVDALVASGVARSAIHTTSVSVYAYGGEPVPFPASGPKAGATATINANASVSADLPDAGVIDRAVSAASGAGAQSVNVWTQQSPPSAPSDSALASALSTATAKARQLATAAAKAAGVTLGSVRSVSTQQPVVCGYSSDGAQLVVGVTIAFAIS
ncbi:MAG TPA: SIMPL domain-containing protein [Candidatus Dormibacteraeota bacterium]|nr:SIMPL domain-containing protein [Candidatus Dormibacteraeota bacterium]